MSACGEPLTRGEVVKILLAIDCIPGRYKRMRFCVRAGICLDTLGRALVHLPISGETRSKLLRTAEDRRHLRVIA